MTLHNKSYTIESRIKTLSKYPVSVAKRDKYCLICDEEIKPGERIHSRTLSAIHADCLIKKNENQRSEVIIKTNPKY